MTRILGQLPGSLEKLAQNLFKRFLLPQQNSRGRHGPRLAIRPKQFCSVKLQDVPHNDTSKLPANQPSSLLQTQSQLRSAEKTTQSANTDSTGSQREQIVLTALDTAGVTDINERAMFMAQMSHESGGFTRLTENLNYKPARLLAIFPKKFTSLEDAQAVVGGGQSAIAERIYGNRKTLGNVHPGDGFRFRGRGIVQLTGRSNYRQAGQAIGIDLEASPDKAAELEVAVKAALWFWQSRNISSPAQKGDVEKVTRLINGGTIGLAERVKEYEVWQRKIMAK